ncbi:MAG: hydroxymyristoyl-ACP dehydratase [Clostridium lundense]|nr:hydroxymyristoyl-ACP dehydratase [Clostridium lundense]
MMNINCSENCMYERDGICTFNTILSASNCVITNEKCGYYTEKESTKKVPPTN